jgi:hypothetical protein
MLKHIAVFTFTLSLTPPSFAIEGDVRLTLNVTKQSGNRVQLTGTTNLPAGTELMLSVSETMENGFLGQSACSVSTDGMFESDLLGPKSGLKDGLYVAEAIMPISAVQPDGVRVAIGKNGENLKGPLVNKGSIGVTVSQSKKFSIGKNAREAQAARKKDADAATAALKQKVCVLLKELLTFKDEPKFKEYGFGGGGPYNKWLKKVESLRSSTPTGLRHPIPFQVRAAPHDLLLIGMDFMQKGETDFTRQRLPELKTWVGYEDFLKPESKARTSTPILRNWRDATGKFSIEATLVKKTETHVVLRRSDGNVIYVPLEKLSIADVEFANRKQSQ